MCVCACMCVHLPACIHASWLYVFVIAICVCKCLHMCVCVCMCACVCMSFCSLMCDCCMFVSLHEQKASVQIKGEVVGHARKRLLRPHAHCVMRKAVEMKVKRCVYVTINERGDHSVQKLNF